MHMAMVSFFPNLKGNGYINPAKGKDCSSLDLPTGCLFFLAPPNLTMFQAHNKFLYSENFLGGQFKLYRAWDLVKLGGARQKKTPCIFLIRV